MVYNEEDPIFPLPPELTAQRMTPEEGKALGRALQKALVGHAFGLTPESPFIALYRHALWLAEQLKKCKEK